MAQPFDTSKFATAGDPAPIAEQVQYLSGLSLGHFSTSQDGVLDYTAGNNEVTRLTWIDRSGKPGATVGEPGLLQSGAISPDGLQVAASRLDLQTGSYEIWLHDISRGTSSRFTFGPKSSLFPVWSRDAGSIVFSSTRNGLAEVYRKATSGAAQDELLDATGQNAHMDGWSWDGAYMIEERQGDHGRDIWLKPVSGGAKAFRYLHSEFDEHDAKPSPAGPWLAYASTETRRNEVYVQTFPTPSGKWQISTNGGALPVWSRDGKELFFVSADRKLMAVEVKTGGGKFEAGPPRALFETRLGIANQWFDVAKDGRFLMAVRTEQPVIPITVVVNWNAALKRP